jgi:hypothetical protein
MGVSIHFATLMGRSLRVGHAGTAPPDPPKETGFLTMIFSGSERRLVSEVTRKAGQIPLDKRVFRFAFFAALVLLSFGCSTNVGPSTSKSTGPKSTGPQSTELAIPTTAKWRPKVGRGNEVISVLSPDEVCGLLTPGEVEAAFKTKLVPDSSTYERALFANGRFSGCTFFVDNDRKGRVSWKVQSWPFEVDRMTDPSMNKNGEFPKALARTVDGKPAALQDFSTVAGVGDGSYGGLLLTVDIDTYSVLLSSDSFDGHRNRDALMSLGEALTKRIVKVTPVAPVTPTATTATAKSAYELNDRQLCELIRDASVLRWKPDSKLGRSGKLECDIDLRVGVDSNIRTTKSVAELQAGERVELQDIPGDLVSLGSRNAHVVMSGSKAFPELAAWVVLQDDFTVMFRVFGLKDTPSNRTTVLDELNHVVGEFERLAIQNIKWSDE